MKANELSLMAVGGIAAVTLIAVAASYLYPAQARAQSAASASAPGGVSMTVTLANFNNIIQNTQSQAGAIIMQDSINRKVTVVSFIFSFPSTVAVPVPTVTLSNTNAQFNY